MVGLGYQPSTTVFSGAGQGGFCRTKTEPLFRCKCSFWLLNLGWSQGHADKSNTTSQDNISAIPSEFKDIGEDEDVGLFGECASSANASIAAIEFPSQSFASGLASAEFHCVAVQGLQCL